MKGALHLGVILGRVTVRGTYIQGDYIQGGLIFWGLTFRRAYTQVTQIQGACNQGDLY